MNYLDTLDPKLKAKIENRLIGMREGIAAAELGHGQRHCPYASGHPLRKGWRIGCRRRSKQLKKEREENALNPNVLLIEPGLQPTRFSGGRLIKPPVESSHLVNADRARQPHPSVEEKTSFTKDLKRIYKAPR